MKLKNNPAGAAALGGILCAQAIALSWLEGLIPAVPWMPPGAKPGFSNIVTMFAAGSLGPGYAFTITFIKALFAFLTRGATAGAMSLAGGLVSTLIMLLLLKKTGSGTGIIGVSVVCALSHNMAQLAVSAGMTGTRYTLYYAPVLGIAAVITGAVTGIILKAVLPALNKQKYYFR